MRLAYVLGLALAAATPVAAQNNAQPPAAAQPAATIPYPTPLYRMDDVSRTLSLTPEQVTRLNKVTEQVQAQYRDNYTKLSGLAEAQRIEQMRDLNRQYAEAWDKAARDVFNDTQRTRYQQLAYQYGGFETLYDPAVQKRLVLTPTQASELSTHWDWHNRQWQDLSRVWATDPTKGAQVYKDYWTQRQERFNRFLTAEQQKAWREMTGDPYTFQPAFGPRR